MGCPHLCDLPSSPKGKFGWPWTEESLSGPPKIGGNPWPRVSIVTPSYNHIEFLEETIRSVLLQAYPYLEYIIIDGGSTDGSIDVVRRYEKWLAAWVSQPDRGQSDAINKGWQRASGDILAYLNSDDLYLPGTIRKAVEYLVQHPNVGMVHGDSEFFNGAGTVFRRHYGRDMNLEEVLRWSGYISQPTVFLRREVLQDVGLMDTNMHYAMDYDLWIRIALKHKIKHIRHTFAMERHHQAAKTVIAPDKGIAGQIYALEKFFSQDLPQEIMALKNQTYARHYVNMAYYCFGVRRLLEARSFAIRAVRLYPAVVFLRKTLLLLVFATFLGPRFANWLRTVRRALRRGQSERFIKV